MRTLLFDIDGTLLRTPRAGSQALSESMRREFSLGKVSCDLDFAGRTDREIVGELLRINGIECTPRNQGRLRRRYGIHFRQVIRAVRGELMPGVYELLGRLASNRSVRLAVMTGNFPETARMKLEAFGLLPFFSWVVGGDLDVSRCEMARRASAQLERHRIASRASLVASSSVIVIGDTTSDVRCARSIGARSLAVCTGSASRTELESANADQVVADLTDQAAFSFLVE